MTATAATDALTLAEAAQLYRAMCRKWPDQRTCLYAIQAGEDGPVKLGLADRPGERLKTLQTGNAAELRGLAAWRVFPCEEKLLHEDYAYARIRGEWFRPVPELVAEVLLLGGDFEDWA